MTREEVKQEFTTKQPSINECEFCPNKGIRLWKCAELHGCKWAQAMMEIAKMLEAEPCDDCISRDYVLQRFKGMCELCGDGEKITVSCAVHVTLTMLLML